MVVLTFIGTLCYYHTRLDNEFKYKIKLIKDIIICTYNIDYV